MSAIYIKAVELRQRIEALLREHKELADDEELRLDVLEGETSLDDVLEQVVEKALEARSMADAVQVRVNDLNERRSRFLLQHDFFRQLAFGIMQSADVNKHVLPIATLSIQRGRQSVVLTDEPENLPPQFQRHKIEADKKALLEALKSGDTVPGAALSNSEPNLVIRTK